MTSSLSSPSLVSHASPAPDFSARLIAWQRIHGRHDLPWQGIRDPYRIWLSEIMLQQTQVATVIPYYARFLERFPDVAALAAAPVEEVMALWSGLGYYARARNLHRAAEMVMTAHGGRFPITATALAELPGVGRSTAAAIAAFAGNERAAILDGNVKRVLCRHFVIEEAPTGKTEQDLWRLAEALLPGDSELANEVVGGVANISAYTQGLMDLGAMVCLRKAPRCEVCPLCDSCQAQAQNRQAEFPVPVPGKSKAEKRERFLLICDATHILLKRRVPSGIWGGLLCPPSQNDNLPPAIFARIAGQSPQLLPSFRHVFTHFRLEILPEIYRISPPPLAAQEIGWVWLPLADAPNAGLPAPMVKLISGLRIPWGLQPQAETL